MSTMPDVGATRSSQVCWTMQGTWDRPQYTNVQMPFPDRRRTSPRRTRPASTSGRSSCRRAGGRRVVLHVGAAESVLIVRGQRRRGRHRQGLAARRGVRHHERRPRRAPTPSGSRSSSGPTRPSSRTRTSGGTAASPARCPCTRRGRTYLADIRAIGGLADDLTTGTLELDVHVAFAGGGPQAGWMVEASLEGIDEPCALGRVARGRRAARREPVRPRSLMRAGAPAARHSTPTEQPTGRRCTAQVAPPLEAGRAWRIDVPDVAPWSAETPHALRPDGARSRPRRVESRRRRPSASASDASRSRAGPAHQRPAGPHPRRQPPRLRPHTGRVVTRSTRCARTSC